jgi:hypothetical protein
MPCGCAHTRMSLSSTTTSDSRRSPKPPDSRVNLGVSRFSGRLDRAGFRRDSAGDPLQMPPYADQGVSSTTIWAMTQSSPGPIWLTASRTTQSSASVTSCASRYRSLSLQISLRTSPILAAPPRAPRACRVTRAAPPEAMRTSMPLLQIGVVVRVRGITQVRAEVDLHAEQVVAAPGGPDAPIASGLFEVVAGRVRLAGAISHAGMTAGRATASKYSATVPGRIST